MDRPHTTDEPTESEQSPIDLLTELVQPLGSSPSSPAPSGSPLQARFDDKLSNFASSLLEVKTYITEQFQHLAAAKSNLEEEKLRALEFDRALCERESALDKRIATFQQRIRDVENDQDDTEVVELNVGGEHMMTKLSTLTSIEGSMLEAMFSGRHLLKKVGDRYFIDRDPKLFRYILAYLRDRVLHLPEDAGERSMLMREFDYFCITPLNPADDFITCEWRNVLSLGGHDDIVMCLRFLPPDRLISGSKDKTMRLWNVRTGKCIRTFEGHTSSVRHLKVVENWIITASHDKSLKIWDMNTGNIVKSLVGHNEYIMCIKVAKRDDLIYSGAHDATVKVWQLSKGTCIHTFVAHECGVSCLKVHGSLLYTFSPFPTVYISGSDDKTIKIWSRTTWQCLRVLRGHDQYVMSIKIRNNFLYSGSWDKNVRVWNLSNGECVQVLEGHTQGVYSIKVIGDIVVSCSGDNTIRIWDSKSGTCHRVLEGHKRHVMTIKVIGNTIYSGSSDKTIKVWKCLPEKSFV